MKNKKLARSNLLLISILISVVYWWVESLTQFYFLKKTQPFEIIPSDTNELLSRIFICGLLISFGLYAAYSKQCAQSQEKDKNIFLYKTLLDTATEAFFLHNKEGKFLDVNKLACSSLGYTRDELLEMSVEDIEIGPDPGGLKQLWEKLNKGENVLIEGRHCRKDGSTFPVEVSLGLIHIKGDFLFSVLARDITKRKYKDEVINISAQKMALHIQGTPMGVIEWDKNFCVTEWNPSAESIFGYSRGEAIGHHAKELLIPINAIEHVDMVWNQLLALENGLRSTNENITKDGASILCEWYNTPLVDNLGEVIGVASLVQDVTKEKNTETALIEAKISAEYANNTKSMFLTHMSHELRTPMNAIIGYSQILEFDEGLSKKQSDSVKTILNAAYHLLELIESILNLTDLKASEAKLKLEEHSLNKIVDESLSDVKKLADDNEIQIINNIIQIESHNILVDDARFKQALYNLLSNAIKYNKDEGTVTVSCDVIDKQHLRLSVCDTGNGLTEQEQKQLFKPFERIGKYSGVDGAGIGLIISKYSIELMGGAIGVKSSVGKGSCFWLEVMQS